ncbi:FtsQ-type POTRA domain-containing protein [Brevibacterium ihuae]|uniref:FtsQ-type POTRA domain-containing protein n=1 Tax=Brevibacterium ihuae TaxID=1631743 RepID=UPI000C75DEE7|nr:FtsQ-type POTRA domain-containing protein [Brevibacterium ihuae]
MSTASLADRLAARRRARIRTWAIVGAVAALVLGLAAAAWFTPVLELRAVEVTGAELTDPAEVEDAVLASHGGTPLPQIRLSRVEDELVSAFPKAASVEVGWAGPNALSVAVTDREPVLAVPADGGWDRYDVDGEVIDSVADEPKGLPVLALEDDADVPGAVSAVVAFLDAVPAEQRAGVTSMSAGSGRDLRMRYDHEGTEVTVLFGSPEDAARKFEVARALMATGATEIDVSVPEVPVTR